MVTHQPKMLRIVRTVTTVTDVDLSSYFDYAPHIDGSTIKRQWTAEEAIAFERSRGQADQQEAFELAMQNDEYDGCRLSFDIITDASHSLGDVTVDITASSTVGDQVQAIHDGDPRTADERTADEFGAVYMTPSRDGSLIPHFD